MIRILVCTITYHMTSTSLWHKRPRLPICMKAYQQNAVPGHDDVLFRIDGVVREQSYAAPLFRFGRPRLEGPYDSAEYGPYRHVSAVGRDRERIPRD